MAKLFPFQRTGPKKPNHAVMATLAACAVLGVTAVGVQLFGDPSAGAPRIRIALDGPAQAEAAPAATAPLADVIVDPSLDAGYSSDPAAAEGGPIDPNAPIIDLSGQGGAIERPRANPLPSAPIASVFKQGPNGGLPVIGPNGATPFTVYKRPFKPDGRKPRLAIIVGGLGFNARTTQQAINELPADVTLSFMPYAKDLQTWIDKARADGHEVILEVPMEPFDSEANDTGPQTLLAGADARENISRLENLLARGAGYFAVMNYQGGKFAASAQASAPVIKAMKSRGLALVGAGVSARSALGLEASRAGMIFTGVDRAVDARQDAESIDEQLLMLEALALQNGSALGAGFAYPVTIEQIEFWAASLSQRGYQLVPASAVLEARAGGR
jgi:polysaccharide deacetylase 2 family uncharacterized protein YibQ